MRLAKRAPRIVFAMTMSLSLVACDGGDGGGDDDDCGDYEDPSTCVDPTGIDTQYVADSIIMPTSPNEAQQLGLDLDGDEQGRPDNALGQILSVLASQGDLDLQASIDEQVADGGLLLLFNLRATGLTTASGVGSWVFLGDNPSPEPCTDPDNIATCGQHLDGNGSFDIAAESPRDAVLAGNLIVGMFKGGPGKITLELSLGDVDPISLSMIGARMEVKVNETDHTLLDGKLGGAITQDELDNNVLPAIVSVMEDSIGPDCMGSPSDCDCSAESCLQADGTPADCTTSQPDCCVEGSTGETIIDLFDNCSDDSTTCDCAVTLQELRENDLISSLLSPDVDLLDADGNFNPRTDGVKDALSLGIGFSAVEANFDPLIQ